MNARQAVFDFPGFDLEPHQLLDFISSCRAPSTRKAYAYDWSCFREWCEARQLEALPATHDTVAQYLGQMATVYKPMTLARRLASISVMHQTAGHTTPTTNILVRNTLSGIRRHYGVAQDRKAPIRATNLNRAIGTIPNDLKGLRDKAILLIGYVGALRRSELVAIRVQDLKFVDQGIRLTIPRSKGDQEGRGITMGIGYGTHSPTCPVKALMSWLEASGIDEGPVFRSVGRYGSLGKTRLEGRAVSTIIKNLAPNLGVDRDSISGHSLRAGFITDQYAVGTAEAVIMERSRHKSHAVMSVYRREADMFAFNYGAKVGL